MSDLINRQDAIDAVWKLDKEATEYVVDDDREIHGYCTAIGVCVGELSSIPSADRPTEWIPVSERLPIPPTFCLVTTDGSHGDVIDIALYMSDGWHKASEVLAWMPLPPPYEGGETV